IELDGMKKACTRKVLLSTARTSAIRSSTGSSRQNAPFFLALRRLLGAPACAPSGAGAGPLPSGVTCGGAPPAGAEAPTGDRTAVGCVRASAEVSWVIEASLAGRRRYAGQRAGVLSRFSLILAAFPRSSRR